jgi:hypothetical protein
MRLLLHSAEVESIFDLFGYDEKGLTNALGLILSENKELLRVLANNISDKNYKCDDCEIRLQEFGIKDRGFTDIELFIDKDLFAIIEAKRGWNLPGQKQLDKYISSRFEAYKPYKRLFVVISECTRDYAERELEKLKLRIRLKYISWQEILFLIQRAYSNSTVYQKRMLKHLETYFRKVIPTQNRNSNEVFCVVLDDKNFRFVMKEHTYDYPLGKGWPHDPPNYIAFRRKGKLHSIHHVDRYEIEGELQGPRVKLFLGKQFKPTQEVKNGNIWGNGHVRFDLDTVFICRTIAEARDLTNKRKENI